MNKNFCKVIDDGAAIEYAPSQFFPNPETPSEAEYLAHGWLKNAITGPSPAEGYMVASTRYEARGESVYAVYEYAPIPAPVRTFSKLKIYGAIVSLPDANGVTAWERVKAWLEGKTIGGVNGWMAFQLAQDITDDHPLFEALADEARQLLGLTEEQFDALLNECTLEK